MSGRKNKIAYFYDSESPALCCYPAMPANAVSKPWQAPQRSTRPAASSRRYRRRRLFWPPPPLLAAAANRRRQLAPCPLVQMTTRATTTGLTIP